MKSTNHRGAKTDWIKPETAELRRLVTVFTPGEGRPFLTTQQAQAWLDAYNSLTAASIIAHDVVAWRGLGVQWPQERPAGVSLADTRHAHKLGTPLAEVDTRWVGASEVCIELLARALGSGVAPQTAIGLFRAVPGTGTGRAGNAHRHDGTRMTCWWSEDAQSAAVEFAGAITGLDWSAITLCLRAGMSTSEAKAWVEAGSEMDSVRVMAALHGPVADAGGRP